MKRNSVMKAIIRKLLIQFSSAFEMICVIEIESFNAINVFCMNCKKKKCVTAVRF